MSGSGWHATSGSVAFMPSGTAVVGQQDGTLAHYDAETGERLAGLAAPVSGVRVAAFSPAGRFLATAGNDGSVTVRHAVNGTPIRTLQPGACSRLAFTPDSKTLVGTTDEPNPRVCAWDAESGAELFARAGHTGPISCLALHPAGRLVATAGHDATVRLWDLAQTRPSWGLDTGASSGSIGSVAFTPEGRYLILGHRNGCLSVLHAVMRRPAGERLNFRRLFRDNCRFMPDPDTHKLYAYLTYYGAGGWRLLPIHYPPPTTGRTSTARRPPAL